MAFTTLPSAGAKLRASVLESLITEVRPVAARKTAAESISSNATYQDDDELTVSVVANAVYAAHLHLNYTSPTTADLRCRVTVPSGTSVPAWTGGFWTGTVIDLDMSTGTAGIAASGTSDPLDCWGVVIVGSTAGSVTVQWAQSTSDAGTTSVNAGSFLLLHRIS